MAENASDAGYAGGVELVPSFAVESNWNNVLHNTIQGTGGWAISVNAFEPDPPCQYNSFLDNVLHGFRAEEDGAVFFGPRANYNLFAGDVGDGIIDLGTGNVVR